MSGTETEAGWPQTDEELDAIAEANDLVWTDEDTIEEKIAALEAAGVDPPGTDPEVVEEETTWPRTHAALDAIASDNNVEFSATNLKVDEKIAELEAAGLTAGPQSAGGEELLPLITTSLWVRLNTHASIPEQFRGRDAVVVRAPSERQEADEFSDIPYDKQTDDTLFLVRERDSAQLLELKREAFTWYGVGQPLGPVEPIGE